MFVRDCFGNRNWSYFCIEINTFFMLSHNRQKRKAIFRTICMVMLMLIQFDAYIYEMAESFRMNQAVSMATLPSEASQMAEDNETVDAWSDPYYRNANLRHRLLTEVTPVLLAFFFFIPVGIVLMRQHRKIDLAGEKCLLSSCLVFCVLLI